jgi:hypothetical protein
MKRNIILFFLLISVVGFSQKKITKEYEKIESYKDDLSWVYRVGLIGIIDSKGKERIPCAFDKITFYQDDLYWVLKNDLMGLYSINHKKPIIKADYEKFEHLEDNKFKVYRSGLEQIIELK